MKAPSLAVRLLLCLLLTHLLTSVVSFPINFLILIIGLLLVCYFLMVRFFNDVGVFRLRALSIIIYVLFILFGWVRINYQEEVGIKGRGLEENIGGDNLYYAKIIEGEVKKGKFSSLLCEVDFLEDENRRLRVSENVLVLYNQPGNEKSVALGDEVVFRAGLKEIKNSSNPFAFDAKRYWGTKGVRYQAFVSSSQLKVLDKKASLSSWFYKRRKGLSALFFKVLESKEASVASALVLGDKETLNPEVKQFFTAAGAMHVLAVSGLHVGMLLMCLQFVFSKVKLLRKKGLYFIVALVFLWFYAFLTGASPSVIRATTMFSFLVVGKLRGYGFFSLDSLATTALVMLLLSPSYLHQIGFQLSFSAMFAIALFYERIVGVVSFRLKVFQKMWEGLAVCCAAQIGTVPLCLYYFHQFPNYFILTNLLLIVLAFSCMLTGVIFLLTAFVPILNEIITLGLKLCFNLLLGSIEFIARLPYALSEGVLIELWEVVIIYALILGVHAGLKQRKIKLFIGMFIGITICILHIQYQSKKHRMRSEVYFLESSFPTVVYSEGGKHLLIYPAQANVEKLEFFKRNYIQGKGGEFISYPLYNQSFAYKKLFCSVASDSMTVEYGTFSLKRQINQKSNVCLEIDFP